MKKILSILFLATVFVAGASAQQLEKLFEKYMEDERFNYVYQKKPSTLDRWSDMAGNQTAPEAFFFFAHPFFLVSI